jgi:hypothetical protein
LKTELGLPKTSKVVLTLSKILMNSQTLEKKALWQLRESLQVVWSLSELNPKPPIFEDQTWIAKNLMLPIWTI